MRSSILIIFFCYCQFVSAQSFTIAYGGDSTEYLGQMIRTSDGGYLMVGSTDSYGDTPEENRTGFIVKTNALGILEWSFAMGDSADVHFAGAVLRDDGGYFVVGRTQYVSADPWKIVLVNIDPTGSVIWSRLIRTLSDLEQERPTRMISLGNNEYLIIGERVWGVGTGSDHNYMAMKINGNADVIWSSEFGYGSLFFELEYALDVLPLMDGGYLIAGRRPSSLIQDSQFQLAKIDANGAFLWDRLYDAPEISNSNVAMKSTSDGILLLRRVPEGTLLMKMNNVGDPVWQKVYSHELHMNAAALDIRDNGDIIFASTIGSPVCQPRPLLFM